MNNENQQYGVITEQGDLGLGYEPITESEKEQIEKKKRRED